MVALAQKEFLMLLSLVVLCASISEDSKTRYGVHSTPVEVSGKYSDSLFKYSKAIC